MDIIYIPHIGLANLGFAVPTNVMATDDQSPHNHPGLPANYAFIMLHHHHPL